MNHKYTLRLNLDLAREIGWQAASLHLRGAYISLCLASVHADEQGWHTEGQPLDTQIIARFMGCSEGEAEHLMDELAKLKLADVLPDGQRIIRHSFTECEGGVV